MNELISLAVYVGRLEARVEALEKRRETAPPVHMHIGRAEEPQDETADRDAQTAARLLQEGIDSIMNYQGPGKAVGDA